MHGAEGAPARLPHKSGKGALRRFLPTSTGPRHASARSWSVPADHRQHVCRPQERLRGAAEAPRRSFQRPPGALPRAIRTPPPRPRCSNTRRRPAVLHRSGENFLSTAWGSRSCPYCFHRGDCRYSIRPGQGPGDLWPTVIHSLWTKYSSTEAPQCCPPAAHRPGCVVPSFSTPLSTVRQHNTRFHRAE